MPGDKTLGKQLASRSTYPRKQPLQPALTTKEIDVDAIADSVDEY